MVDRRITVRLTALAAVVLGGAGACAFEPQGTGAGGGEPVPVSAVERETGASATPAPTRTTVPPRRKTPQRTVTTQAGTPRALPSQSSPPKASVGCPQGEYQKQVETYLAKLGGFGPVVVDGRQSSADCWAIKKFQTRYGIEPAEGRAGPTTYDVAKRLAETDVRQCRTGSGTTFCIDLTRQTVWAMRGSEVVLKPTVTRTGMAGYATPTGTYKINFRNVREWSDPYEVWLPYWQRFVGGIGFHQTTTYLHNKPIGSHGCVNLLPSDAKRFWDLGRVGDRVYVFGRRPGT